MGGNSNNSIENNSNMISRNTPVSLVVGAAGFLGSNLSDALLRKGIQVVGVDNLSSGKMEYLKEASKDKKFHFFLKNAQEFEFDFPRLDYIFIATDGSWNIEGILKIFKKLDSRCIFISSIDLYSTHSDKLQWLKDEESKLAKFAHENKLNARIIRLGSVFGPRMHFRISDPIITLINEALRGDLQKDIHLDFSSRALYVDDAIDLIIRSVLVGSTAQKIFDGVWPSPIKVAEVKQVLLDPVWYEQRDFSFSDLPPWPTPNLDKTIHFLNWHPKAKLVSSLKETITYFKDGEVEVPEIKESEVIQKGPLPKKDEIKDENILDDRKKKDLEAIKFQAQDIKKVQKGKAGDIWKKLSPKFYLLIILALIGYAIFYPVITLGWGIATFKFQLTEAEKNLINGEFDKSLINISQAESGVVQAGSIIASFEPLRKIEILSKQFESADSLIKLAQFSTTAAKSTILGTKALYQGLKSIVGEINESPFGYLEEAQIELALADNNLSKAQAAISDEYFIKTMPDILKSRVESLGSRLKSYHELVSKARSSAFMLPKIIGGNSKSYLILLQNNNELRPTGGFIGSFAKVSFEGGKLKKLEVNDIYAIDGQLKIKVVPPKEIKEDLGQQNWYLRDSNWEADFPTSARQAEWFFTQETGERVSGVLAMDVSAMENLLKVVGPLTLSDYGETINSDNLFSSAITHAEVSFFAGSQAKRSFLTALSTELFNKLFFIPNQNWPGIVTALGKSLDEKHMSIYLDDPTLFSYLVSQNWAAVLPRQGDEKNDQFEDILVPVEANLGANKSNYYIDRNYALDTVIGKDNQINHRLRVSYTNRSPSNTWPAGIYKNRMRVYMPFGTKVSRILWGESDITKNATNFVDYGRSAVSFLLELQPKEQRNLIIDYVLSTNLTFEENKVKYRLNVIKQAGTHKDPFIWKLTYPINLKLKTENIGESKQQELTISTDLSKDRSFEVEFEKL